MTDILDLIDCALDDCAVSGDAMRWSPEPVEEDDFIAAMRARVAEIFAVPPGLLWDHGTPPRGIISACPEPPVIGWINANVPELELTEWQAAVLARMSAAV